MITYMFFMLNLSFLKPYAGSDVARIRTTAKRTPCGKFFIINGVKKWITTGIYIYRLLIVGTMTHIA